VNVDRLSLVPPDVVVTAKASDDADRDGRAPDRAEAVRLSLLPKKSEFFVLFEQHAEDAVEAAEGLAKPFGDFTDVENKVRDIHAIEITATS
jgi:hypothetical protein